ncbi:MAG TPA: hypothetical protein VF781_15755 [Solirubrobacteraceae bacterium]
MRPRLLSLLSVPAAALALAACGSSSGSSSRASRAAAAPTTAASTTAAASSSQLSYEAVPLEVGPSLGSASSTQIGRVDGITCGPTEQLAYHIHAHLAVFADGRLYALPAGIGIPGSVTQQTSQGPVAAGGQCIYWLHTHTSDGIIHIESPTQRVYTLGNFFDEWHQPLSATQVASLHGAVTAFVNGKPWKRSLRDIPLLPHGLIQLNLGSPAPPPMSVNWSQTGL